MFNDPELVEFSLHMKGLDDEKPDVEELPDDPLQKLLSDCELAGAFGQNGHQDVDELRSEIAELDERNERLQKIKAAQKRNVSDGARLEKRFRKGQDVARFEKSGNGRWMYEYSASGELLRGYEIEA